GHRAADAAPADHRPPARRAAAGGDACVRGLHAPARRQRLPRSDRVRHVPGSGHPAEGLLAHEPRQPAAGPGPGVRGLLGQAGQRAHGVRVVMGAAVRAGIVLAAVVATGLGAWLAWGAAPRTAMPPASQVSTTTAPVTRGDVVRRVTVAGTMGYDGQYQVV